MALAIVDIVLARYLASLAGPADGVEHSIEGAVAGAPWTYFHSASTRVRQTELRAAHRCGTPPTTKRCCVSRDRCDLLHRDCGQDLTFEEIDAIAERLKNVGRDWFRNSCGDDYMSGAFVIVGAHPADVSAALKLNPDRAWVAGERNAITLRGGRTIEFSSTNSQSGWKKFSPDELIEPEEIIEYWVDFVKEHASALRQLPAEASVSIAVLVQEDQRLDLSPGALATLGNAAVGLCLTVQVMVDA